jgi:hypothetical protein
VKMANHADLEPVEYRTRRARDGCARLLSENRNLNRIEPTANPQLDLLERGDTKLL